MLNPSTRKSNSGRAAQSIVFHQSKTWWSAHRNPSSSKVLATARGMKWLWHWTRPPSKGCLSLKCLADGHGCFPWAWECMGMMVYLQVKGDGQLFISQYIYIYMRVSPWICTVCTKGERERDVLALSWGIFLYHPHQPKEKTSGEAWSSKVYWSQRASLQVTLRCHQAWRAGKSMRNTIYTP